MVGCEKLKLLTACSWWVEFMLLLVDSEGLILLMAGCLGMELTLLKACFKFLKGTHVA